MWEGKIEKSLLKSKNVLILAIVLILAVAGIITTVTVISGNKTRQVSKQLSLGEKYLSELEYDKAVIAFNKVIEIEPRNLGAYLGLAEAYEGLGQTEDALRALEVAITVIRDAKEDTSEVLEKSEDIYIKLAELYEENGESEKAFRILLEGYELTDSNKIAMLLKDYYPEIEVSVEPGTYAEAQLISLISKGSKIYYTLDGSNPTKESEVFGEPIEISEENITIKAVVENEFGELGEVKLYTYTIEHKREDLIVAVNSSLLEESPESSISEVSPTPDLIEPLISEVTSTPEVEEQLELTEPENTEELTPTPKPSPTPAPIPEQTSDSEDEVIVWKDATFEKAVRKFIGKPSGDIYKSDVIWISLFEPYITNIKNIENIDDIVNFPNLKFLNLSGYKISDISALSNLTNLTELNLDSTQISDINALSNLDKLTVLRLAHNQISDISALKNLTNLTSLRLEDNQISDISSLKNLTKLTVIYIENNQISEISVLKNLTNLEILCLENNQISDISALSNLTKLFDLRLANNQIINVDALSNFTFFQLLDLSNNQINNISGLKNLSEYTRSIFLEGNMISDWSPVSHIDYVEGRPN